MNSTVRKYVNLFKNVRSWPRYMAYKFDWNRDAQFELQLKPVPIRVNVLRSVVILFKEIFLNEVYEPPFRTLKTDAPLVLDVGANMGYFALYTFLRKPNARVVSFEPVPANYQFLNRHRAAHPQFNWTTFNVAVADQPGILDFFYDGSQSPEGVDTSASLFSPGEIGTVTARHRRIQVETVGLPAWLAEREISKIDVLKLDCEGAEYAILYNLPDEIFHKVVHIVADVHPMRGTTENIAALADFLQKKGYRVRTENEEMLYAERT